MAKKRSHSSDSGSAASSASSDEETTTTATTTSTTSKKVKPTAKVVVSSGSDSSSSDDDDDWNAKPKAKGKGKRGKAAKKPAKVAAKKKFKPSESSDNEESSSAAASSASEEDEEVEEEVEEPKKRRKAKVAKGGRSRSAATSRMNSEEREEGEVDDDFEVDEEFNDGYDENLFGDEADRRWLAQLTEKEREQELFNRCEKREVMRSRFEIERRLRKAKKAESLRAATNKSQQQEPPSKKALAPEKAAEKAIEKQISEDALAAERLALVDSSGRSLERRRNMEEKHGRTEGLKGLKAEREKRKLKQKLRAADVYSDSSADSDSDSDNNRKKKRTPKRTSASSSSSSSSSSSDSSDDDSDAKGGKSGKSDKESRRARRGSGDAWGDKGGDLEEDKFNFDLVALNSIRISRFKMEKWCHAPFFNDAVVGAFVRVGIGNVGSAPQYIVGQIADVLVTAKIYNLGKARTNKGIKISYGRNPERTYRLEFVSNSEFTREEWEKYIGKMAADNCPLPNREFVERKKADIVRACNYQFSDTDVAQIVAEKEKLRRDTPVNFAMRKTQLMKDKEFAEQNNQHERASELKAEIDRLEEVAKKRDTIRTKNIASISYINERNRQRNIKEAEKVIAEAAKEGNLVKDDPFTRQRCAPKMISNFSKNKGADGVGGSSGKAGGASQGNGENGAGGVSSQGSTSTSGSLSTTGSTLAVSANGSATAASSGKSLTTAAAVSKSAAESASEADDLFSAHNFDIKIDFDIPLLDVDAAAYPNGKPAIGGVNGYSNSGMALTANSQQLLPPPPPQQRPPNSMVTTVRRSLNLAEYKKKKGLI